MAETVNPSRDNGPIQKRLSKIERVLSGLTRNKIKAKDFTGRDVVFDALTGTNIPTKPSGSFICTSSDGKIAVTSGSYQYPLGTNVDVDKTDPTGGTYAYAIIKQTAGGVLDAFTIEVTSDTKDPTNMDVGGSFVQFSNVLLAELVDDDGVDTFIQRRIGNLSLVYRLINGSFCLWAETTGGEAL